MGVSSRLNRRQEGGAGCGDALGADWISVSDSEVDDWGEEGEGMGKERWHCLKVFVSTVFCEFACQLSAVRVYTCFPKWILILPVCA